MDFVDGANLATMAALLVSLVAFAWETRANRSAMQAATFIAYTDRYNSVMDGLAKHKPGIRLGAPPPFASLSPEERIWVLKYLNLCSEEFYMHVEGMISERTWQHWKREIEDAMQHPPFSDGWTEVRGHYDSVPDFQRLIDTAVARAVRWEEGRVSASMEGSTATGPKPGQ